MKQHIMVEQLREVKPTKLLKILKYGLAGDDRWAESINIGKMIEVLSNYKQIEIIQGKVGWIMFMDNSLKISGDELCDALWEAIKYVIEEE